MARRGDKSGRTELSGTVRCVYVSAASLDGGLSTPRPRDAHIKSRHALLFSVMTNEKMSR
jgi:hypothetical protein